MSQGVGLLLVLLAAVLLFRLAPGQGVWSRPTRKPIRLLALAASLLVASMAMLSGPFGVMVSAALVLCALMLALCVLPYLGLLKGEQR